MDRNAFHRLLAFGIERGASDLHFEAGYPPHYRVRGELLGAVGPAALTAQDTEAIARILLEDRHVEIDLAGRFPEFDVAYALAQRGRFRASIFRQRGAVGVAMRLIPIQVPSLEELGLPPALAQLAGERRGLVLVTGGTGSGKTTTLAAMVRHINETRHALVVTIEDPIEHVHEPERCLIVQREVGTDTASFAAAMAAALRHDPDVVMLGALADPATIAAALEAVETDHLVLAAVQAPDAALALQRVVGAFEPAAQAAARDRLAGALTAIASLRLLPAADGRGRLAAAEIWHRTDAVRDCLRGGQLGELRGLIQGSFAVHAEQATQSLDQHLAALVARGAISRDTALAAARDPAELARRLSE